MSNTQYLTQKLALLNEISMIMGSLKTIAMLETQQAKSTVSSQRRGLEVISREFVNFVAAYPDYSLVTDARPTVVVILGSERGFCGDFNAQLSEKIDELSAAGTLAQCELLPVGYRLATKLQKDGRIKRSLKGAGVYAEIESQLAELTEVINELSAHHPHASIALLYHDGPARQIRFEPLLAALTEPSPDDKNRNAPLLNLAPDFFFRNLISEYILARLNYILTLSFFSENQTRVQHLESALDQIDEQSESLGKRLNHLRQEQITEELETILMNGGLMETR